MARVIVSAGHTNNDPGTIIGNLREVDLNRAIARKIVAQLRANGIITLSVPPNMDLQKRIDWINGTGYNSEFDDIAIEIHINDGGKSGFEFWFEGQGQNTSQELAQAIMQNVNTRTGLPSQGVKSEFEHKYKSLAFLSKTSTTSVLLECLYIDNKDDAAKLENDDELNKISKAIAEGICNYLKIEYIEAESPKPVQTPPVTQQIQASSNIQSSPSPRQEPQVQQNITRPAFPNNTSTFQQPKPIQTNSLSTKPANNYTTGNYQPTDYYGSAPTGFSSQDGIQSNQPQMSREERKEMIIRLYKKILGREPNQNDLNYFINIGITEDKLIKRMIDSQEHLDLVNSKLDFDQNKEIYEKQKIELSRLKAENNDQKTLLHNLSRLLHQKNRHISEMKVKLEKIDPSFHGFKAQTSEEIKGPEYKGTFSDRVFHFLSSFLG